MEHEAVLKDEALDYLAVAENGIYIDATLGAAGHAQAVLDCLQAGILICFDIDNQAVEHFEEEIKKRGGSLNKKDATIKNYQVNTNQVFLINQNFNNLSRVLHQLNIKEVTGILADLGWSTDQLGSIPGLSFELEDQLLDMRFNKANNRTAAHLLNTASRGQLTQVLTKNADLHPQEVDQLWKLLQAKRPLSKVKDLNDILGEVKSRRKHNILNRVYQALRISVNEEYRNLVQLISAGLPALAVNGRLVTITFHSGEEAIVEDYLDDLASQGKVNYLLDQKYIQPSVSELRDNLKAHSAKLWAVEKLIAQ